MSGNGINLSDLKELFVKYYGESDHEIRIFTAPGRVNLIGEHTDYNGGFVFPGAVDKGIVADLYFPQRLRCPVPPPSG